MKSKVHQITGKVVAGRGHAKNLPFLRDQKVNEFLGQTPFLGTLNLTLEIPIELSPSNAFSSNDRRAFFWPVKFNGLPCLAHRWKRCPLHILEIVSHVRLREEFQLEVGDSVTVAACLDPISLPRLLCWRFLWANSGSLYYESDSYVKRVKKLPFIARAANQRPPNF